MWRLSAKRSDARIGTARGVVRREPLSRQELQEIYETYGENDKSLWLQPA